MINCRIYGTGETTVDLIYSDNSPLCFKSKGAVVNTCISTGRLDINESGISTVNQLNKLFQYAHFR